LFIRRVGGNQQALNKPQFGPSNDIMVIDGGQSYQQRWTVSNFVKVKGSQEDLLPILGSGTYELSTQYSQYGCESSSDTLGVADGFLWGSNYGPKGDEISQTIIDTAQAGGITYSCRLDMPSDSRFFEKIFFFGFENLNPQVPKEIRLKVLTSYGYQDSMVALIGQQGFVEFPVNFDLGPSLNAFLEIELDSGIVYHYFENNQTSFSQNALNFSDLAYAVLGGPINYGRRIPIGFKYSGTVGLEAEEQLPVEVYPNPSTGAIILNWPHRQPGIVEAYDTRGKRVAKYNLKQGQQTISLDLASGIYSLAFPNHPQIKSIKLVIQK